MSDILNTGIKNSRNVLRYLFGGRGLDSLVSIVDERRSSKEDFVVYFVDMFFQGKEIFQHRLQLSKNDLILYVETNEEPTTECINQLRDQLVAQQRGTPCAVVAIGGGIVLDTTKAISNLLTNSGNAEDYQGWDLVKMPGIFKIAIPTISGTGAEATRTCVMTNKKTGLKLGMNSDFTVFDQVILDPDLTSTVPRDQYFYTGMDAYIHCIESLSGQYRNAIGDAYSQQTIKLCREVFLSDEMMSDDNREKLMVASYFGGCAIATSYVGLVHPFSAGLSVVLGLHHCIANCITMRAMAPYYEKEYAEFWAMVDKQGISIPSGVCSNLTDEQFEYLYASTIVHEKPLTNALGSSFKEILTKDRVMEIFRQM